MCMWLGAWLFVCVCLCEFEYVCLYGFDMCVWVCACAFVQIVLILIFALIFARLGGHLSLLCGIFYDVSSYTLAAPVMCCRKKIIVHILEWAVLPFLSVCSQPFYLY